MNQAQSLPLMVDRDAGSPCVHARTNGHSVQHEDGVSPGTESPSPAGRLLRAREVGQVLAVSTRSVWRLAAAGQIPPPVRFGGTTRWRQDDLTRFLGSQTADGRLTASEPG